MGMSFSNDEHCSDGVGNFLKDMRTRRTCRSLVKYVFKCGNSVPSFRCEILDHSSYSSDLLPCYIHMFDLLNKALKSRSLDKDAEVLNAFEYWIRSHGIFILVILWGFYLSRQGDNV